MSVLDLTQALDCGGILNALDFCLVYIAGNSGGALLHRGDGARTGHAAAGTAHTLQQVAIVLAGPWPSSASAALPQTVGVLHQDLPLRVDLGNGLLHRVGHAAGDGEAPAQRGTGGELVVGVVGHLGGDDALGVEDTLHLLEGEHESTSLRMVRREASSFLAVHGPMNTMRTSGWSFLYSRAVSTMGVMAMEM